MEQEWGSKMAQLEQYIYYTVFVNYTRTERIYDIVEFFYRVQKCP